MSNIEIQYETGAEMDVGEGSDVEHNDPSIETPTETAESTSENEEILNKPVKHLTKDERAKLTEEFESGRDNKYYKVNKLRNGSFRITKRTNPLTDVDSAHDVVSNRIDTRFGKRLTNDQLLLEHIIDLEKRYEVMRLKHKKLKKRYNKLETDLYESDSDDMPVREVSYEPEYKEIPRKTVEEPVIEPVNNRPAEPVAIPRNYSSRPVRKPSWRAAVSNF